MDLLSEKPFIFPLMHLFMEETLLTKKTQTPVSDQNTLLFGFLWPPIHDQEWSDLKNLIFYDINEILGNIHQSIIE